MLDNLGHPPDIIIIDLAIPDLTAAWEKRPELSRELLLEADFTDRWQRHAAGVLEALQRGLPGATVFLATAPPAPHLSDAVKNIADQVPGNPLQLGAFNRYGSVEAWASQLQQLNAHGRAAAADAGVWLLDIAQMLSQMGRGAFRATSINPLGWFVLEALNLAVQASLGQSYD